MDGMGPELDKAWDPLDFVDEDINYEDPEESQTQLFEDIFKGAKDRCDLYGVPKLQLSKEIDGRETGDDRVDISPSPTTLAVGLTVQTVVFDMKTSEKDTFISSTYWNYCEVSSTLPCGRNQSFHHARKTSNFSQLGYVDTAPMRITIDAQKGDKSHSSTVVGKASMMGLRVTTPNSHLKHKLHLCSYLQDGMLRTYKSPEPKYLPRCLGGSSCPAVFGHWENLYYSVIAYRGGNYHRLYGSATKELIEALRSLEIGKVPSLVLTNRLREKQEYMHATYDNLILVPKLGEIHQVSGKLPVPIIEAGRNQIGLTSVENRLIQSRLLIGERAAISELNAKHKLEEQLLGDTPVISSEREQKRISTESRKKYGNALSANTAFNNLLLRKGSRGDVGQLQKEGFLTATTGVTEFSKEHARWLFKGGRSKTYSIEDLNRNENLYAVEDVSVENTMRVSGISLTPYSSRNPETIKTVSKVGLYQISESKLEWCENIYASIREVYDRENRPLTYDEQLQIYNVNREWINDDNPLIEIIKKDVSSVDMTGKHVLAITNDRKWSKKTASILGIPVYSLDPHEVIKRLPPRDYSSEFTITLTELKMKVLSQEYASTNMLGPYIDYGSLASAAANYEQFLPRTGRDAPVKRVKPVSNVTKENGERIYEYELSEDISPSGARMRKDVPPYTSKAKPTEYLTRSAFGVKQRWS
jgi:hypothetical protein